MMYMAIDGVTVRWKRRVSNVTKEEKRVLSR